MSTKKIMLASVALTVLLPVICTGILSGQTKGKAVFEKVINALGGAEKIKNVKIISQRMEIYRKNRLGEFNFNAAVVIQYPDRILYTLRSTRGHVIMAVDGTEAWQQLPPKSLEPMSDEDRKYEMDMIYRDPIYIFRNLHQYKIEHKGNKEYAGITAIDLFITGPTEFHIYINPQTYLPVGVSSTVTVPGIPDPMEQEEIYSNYKEIDGIKVPLQVTLEAGDDFMKGTTVEVKFNIPVNSDIFKGKNIPQEIMDFINLKNQKPEENANEKNQ